ncbi:MAG: DnaJ domain-containing protein [Candidatus Methanoperedens sp.]|nr:DnaJ domain-containing protein [Candidatus Methanoperedens sp.]
MDKDYYEILQVHPQAEPEVIEAAWRRLARKYHPDVNKSQNAEERMKEINIAYEILGNPERRKQYWLERLKKSGTIPETKPAASEPPPVRNEAVNEISTRLRVKWAIALGAFGVIIILYIIFFQTWTALEDIGIGKTRTIETTVTPVFTVPEPSTVYVEIKGIGLNPPELNIVKGTTVRWTNMDSAQHIVNGNGFRSPTLNKRDMWNYTFKKTGTFEYDCTIHTSMRGRIIVK